MTSPSHLGLVGYGAIGTEIGRVLTQLGETAKMDGVLVRDGRGAGPFNAVHSVEALLASGARTVLECAGHGAVRAYGADILAGGADLVLTSVGALAEPATVARLRDASGAGGGRLVLAAGAVGGLDGLLGARLGGLVSASYTSIKPPAAWRGTPAEHLIDYDAPAHDQVLFDGTAREAARRFPQNANVAIAVGLCSLGLDDTRAVLMSSPAISDPMGIIEAAGSFGRMRYETFAHASPVNPKTSLLTAYSLLQCARLGQGVPIFELLP